jgi:hypothetical protein
MFVYVTSDDNQYKEKQILNRSETAPTSIRFVVQLTVTTKGAHTRGDMFIRQCADWSHCRLH